MQVVKLTIRIVWLQSWVSFPLSYQAVCVLCCYVIHPLGTNEFPPKACAFVGIWPRLRTLSCLCLFFSFHLFALLRHVPGLHTTLWTDYSSTGLITVNEGLKQGNSRLLLRY